MKWIHLLLWISILCLLTACSDSSSGSESNNSDGIVTFEISGAMNAQMEGKADFDIGNFDPLTTVIISMYDVSPQTFTLEFLLSSNEDIQSLTQGTYPIGAATFDGSQFAADFLDTRNGLENVVEYTTRLGSSVGYGGTLVITESSEDRISGTFEFTAVMLDEEDTVGEEISVTNGEFTAIRDQLF